MLVPGGDVVSKPCLLHALGPKGEGGVELLMILSKLFPPEGAGASKHHGMEIMGASTGNTA